MRRLSNLAKSAIQTYLNWAKLHTAKQQKYILLARKTSMRYKVPFTQEQKRYIRKSNNTLVKPSEQRVRIHRNKIIITDLKDKSIKRRPIR